MPTVMRQMGTALGTALPGDGQYLKDFDFEAQDGRGIISLTPDLAEAKKFAAADEAFTFWKTQPECRPFRRDGNPNRPLTAANWSFENVDDAQ